MSPSRVASPQIRSIPLTSDGWLKVVKEPPSADPPSEKDKFSLPYAVRVKLQGERAGREYFEVLEGPWKGQRASVPKKSRTDSYLQAVSTAPGAASVTFNSSKQSLTYNGRGPFSAFSGAWDYDLGHQHYTTIPPGHYNILIPDAPHRTRKGYHRYTKYAEIWFSISGFKDRYLHFGELSEGCVTVRGFIYDPVTDTASPGALPADCFDFRQKAMEVPGFLGLPYPAKMPALMASWNDLAETLLRSRANEISVGTLIVTK